MIDLGQQLAEWHLLLWVVPFVIGLVTAGIGAWANHRVLVVLALVGVGWPILQALAAAVFSGATRCVDRATSHWAACAAPT